MNVYNLYSTIAECFLFSFLSDVDFFFQFRSVSISIIRHASLFFRSYSGNLPAIFLIFCLTNFSSGPFDF